jgi:ATP-dependent Clp protease adapter protein ClpS
MGRSRQRARAFVGRDDEGFFHFPESPCLTATDFRDVLLLFFLALAAFRGISWTTFPPCLSSLSCITTTKTPLEFVVALLHSVFKTEVTDAFRITEKVDDQGRAICGTYPRDVADELLEPVRERIRAAGHPLRITSRAVADGRCKLCSRLFSDNRLH